MAKKLKQVCVDESVIVQLSSRLSTTGKLVQITTPYPGHPIAHVLLGKEICVFKFEDIKAVSPQ